MHVPSNYAILHTKDGTTPVFIFADSSTAKTSTANRYSPARVSERGTDPCSSGIRAYHCSSNSSSSSSLRWGESLKLSERKRAPAGSNFHLDYMLILPLIDSSDSMRLAKMKSMNAVLLLLQYLISSKGLGSCCCWIEPAATCNPGPAARQPHPSMLRVRKAAATA